MFHFCKVVIFTGLLWDTNPAQAQLGVSGVHLESLLGKSVKKSGDLIYYHKTPYFVVTHLFHGECDQICIFSQNESQGLPNALGDGEIQDILRVYGSGMTWVPAGRLSMNRLWNSDDGKCFAIYETIYNKLVLMTRAAYRREKSAHLRVN